MYVYGQVVSYLVGVCTRRGSDLVRVFTQTSSDLVGVRTRRGSDLQYITIYIYKLPA